MIIADFNRHSPDEQSFGAVGRGHECYQLFSSFHRRSRLRSKLLPHPNAMFGQEQILRTRTDVRFTPESGQPRLIRSSGRG